MTTATAPVMTASCLFEPTGVRVCGGVRLISPHTGVFCAKQCLRRSGPVCGFFLSTVDDDLRFRRSRAVCGCAAAIYSRTPPPTCGHTTETSAHPHTTVAVPFGGPP